MKDTNEIIFDVQILQTPAADRGMGQYVMSLLAALHELSQPLTLLLSSKTDQADNDLAASLNKTFPNFKIAELPLADLKNERNTQSGLATNQQILDDWVEATGLAGSTFIMGSVFQVDVYPVFPADTNKVAIVYDLIPIQLFDQYKNQMRWEDYLMRFSRLYEADKLLCISKTTADDLQVYGSALPYKVAVIDGGPGNFDKVTEPKLKPTKKYILMPTGNDVRKNNRTAVIGFEHFRQSHPDYSLVITSHFSDQEKSDLKKLSPELIFTDSVSNNELAWYYKNCEALLFPSLYEGLGMPLIEAMKFDKPIAASGIEVFMEISSEAPYYFDPRDPFGIAAALIDVVEDSDFKKRLTAYDKVVKHYTWPNTARKVIEAATDMQKKTPKGQKLKLAIVGPYSSGVSAIGKFMGVMHPALKEHFEIEYFFEPSPIDRELRPDILSHVAKGHHISTLTDAAIRKFDGVIYHIGNSNHHTLTAARAMLNPGIAILHDLNLENVFNDLKDRRIIDNDRYELEEKLNSDSKARFIYSIASRQNAVITHSDYARSIVSQTIAPAGTHVEVAELCVDTPKYYEASAQNIFTIGLAGILANIKGLKTIEELAQNDNFKYDKILLFGLNFAEKGVLERLRSWPNVEIATDLTDYQFQQNLKRMSVFVNYRESYQGEASYSTLESMRYGIPVIVRGDFGWYAELPDEAVIKVSSEEQLIEKLNQLKNSPEEVRKISDAARQATAERYNQSQYADKLAEVLQNLAGGES